MSDSPEPKPSKGEKLLKPLPRLWKSESDEPEDGSPAAGKEGAPKKASKQGKAAASSSASKSKSSSGKKKGSKKPVEAGEKEGKKVLLEDTPALDTVESRQRVRLIVGAVGVTLIVGLCWITYRVFLYDSGPKVVSGDDSTLTLGPPDALAALDQEARYMFNRAREDDKNDRTDLAIEMLKKVVKTYKGTPTAADAQRARPAQTESPALHRSSYRPGRVCEGRATAKPASATSGRQCGCGAHPGRPGRSRSGLAVQPIRSDRHSTRGSRPICHGQDRRDAPVASLGISARVGGRRRCIGLADGDRGQS